jgi:hypothetical protein
MRLGLFLLTDVMPVRVTGKVKSPAHADHPSADVLAIERTNGDDTVVTVDALLFAGNGSIGKVGIQSISRLGVRSPRLPVLYAALLSLGGVYSPKTDALTSYFNCVPVYDACAAGNLVIRVRDLVNERESHHDRSDKDYTEGSSDTRLHYCV